MSRWRLVLAVTVLAAACSSRESAEDPAEAGSTTAPTSTTPIADAATPPADGNTSEGASADSALPPDPVCASYCQLVMSSCHAQAAQFATFTACLNGCALYPVGEEGNSYPTRTCHHRHAVAASVTDDTIDHQQTGHCQHAGLFGYGGCGDPCDGICYVAMDWCSKSAGGAVFASTAECKATCLDYQSELPAVIPGIGNYSATGPTSGDTLDCRNYYALTALKSAQDRDMACPQLVKNSPKCK